ncbi:MAG: aminotransferase class I/II-fold pyridoxal phosphate-dependent enzyme [Candidatus Omnitrophica bacterium]|nr:aminotransferase class I/II-fold pyridoxal phosphate-dependent enzyme [Candidatus Omnitrophota bacterium]
MMNNNIIKVKEFLAAAGKEKNTEKITPNSRLLKDLGIDSFSSIELIYNIETAFGISIDEKMLHPELSVNDLLNYLDAQRQPTGKINLKSKESFINSLNVDKTLAEKLNFNPYYQTVNGGLSKNIKINHKLMLNFGSNDYLGLSQNKFIKKSAIDAIKEYGLSMCATPITLGTTQINRALEEKIASFLKQDDAIVYSSGYQANLGIFQALTKENDIVIADKNIHSSLINSILLSKARLKFFSNNDLITLEDILKSSQDKRMRFIVIEGLYSTEGTLPQLTEIIKLSKTYQAQIIIDDAHGIGVLGKNGRGALEHFNAFNDIFLISGSLGKAIGLSGGFLAGNKQTIEYLRYNSGPYFYSTALAAHIAKSAITALEITKKSDKTREKIFSLKNTLYHALLKMNYQLSSSEAPIFSILFKDTFSTLKFSKALFRENIYAVVFLPPSVPQDSPRIRLIVSAHLNTDIINKTIRIFNKIKDEYQR